MAMKMRTAVVGKDLINLSKFVKYSGIICLLWSIHLTVICRTAAVNEPREEVNHGGEEQKNFDDQTHENKIPAADHTKTSNKNPEKVHLQKSKPKVEKAGLRLADTDECRHDVNTLCSGMQTKNNFAVLECLQSDRLIDEVREDCQHVMWKYKLNITNDIRFDSAAFEVCASTLERIPECNSLTRGRGLVIPCLIEHVDQNVTDINCRTFLRRMENIVFSDYRLIYKFTEHCGKDIDELKCGRMADSQDDGTHNQGKTLLCLMKHLANLTRECKHELLRVAELQADDFHNDRPLYYACRDARERFCHNIRAGEGRVYQCLDVRRHDRDMNDECRDMLLNRHKLEAEDYKVNFGLARSCHMDILKHNCVPQLSEFSSSPTALLSTILLCLEGAMQDGHVIRPECIAELNDVRTSLLEDFQMSPVLVRECWREIETPCRDQGTRTIHCLMDLARPSRNLDQRWERRISAECARAAVDILYVLVQLEDVLTEADIGENYEIDPALRDACEPVVATVCKGIRPGEGRIIECLMSSLHRQAMTDECREHLMEVYYFITRDFRLDRRLYRACHEEASVICGAPEHWYQNNADTQAMAPNMGHLVFACLYRYTFSIKSDHQVTVQCAEQVKRVMRERSLTVDLDPEIESACLKNLGEFCSHQTEKYEEMMCLEKNLDKFDVKCAAAVTDLALGRAQDPTIDSIFVEACSPFWDKYCQHALVKHRRKSENKVDSDEDYNEDLAEDLMSCLIENKHHPEMNPKCFAGVEHQQLLALKDYRLSPVFKESCDKYVQKYCRGKTKKSEIVKCLSEVVRDDTMLERELRVGKQCKKQLRFQLLQRSESVHLDPDLEKACADDIKDHCKDVGVGNAATLECLKKDPTRLNPDCKQVLFRRELAEAQDPSTDFYWVSKCKGMIKMYCVDELHSTQSMFDCLRRTKDEPQFDVACRNAILSREQIRAHDIRLNPALEKNCRNDAEKFCSTELSRMRPEQSMEGAVLLCLRVHFTKKVLSETCRKHMEIVIRESAADMSQDIAVVNACKREVTMCREESDGKKDEGRVKQCLERLVVEKRLTENSNRNCYLQIRRLIEESQVDIQSDVGLFKKCAVDVKRHCSEIPPGAGRRVACLVAIYNAANQQLDPECNKTLEDRIEMWKILAPTMAPIDSVEKLVVHAYESPVRNYFAAVGFLCVGVIFIVGLVCGKLSRRVHKNVKDR